MMIRAGPLPLLFIANLILSQVSGQVPASNLQQLAQARQWAELREAAAIGEHAIFYRAMAAASFNEPAAESLFRAVIREEPTSEEAYQAYHWLANIYQKSGRYHSLTAIREEEWKAFPDKAANPAEKREDAPFQFSPDQENGPRQIAVFHHDGRSFRAPATVNGQSVDFFFDNGADLSYASEAEAKRLGLTMSAASGTTGTMTNRTGFRMATAHDVVIGNMRFRNVSFAVFPDSQEPWSLVPLAKRGIIGLPLMVAIGTFRWSTDGTLTIGAESAPLHAERANLIFDAGDHVVLKAAFQGQTIWTSFDSGATTTDIYATFFHRFSGYLNQNGKAARNEIIGLGGRETYDTIDVPELPLEIAGRQLVLRPGHIMTTRSEPRDWISANVGKDLYMQTSGFTLDFGAMRLMLQ